LVAELEREGDPYVEVNTVKVVNVDARTVDAAKNKNMPIN